MREPTDVAEEDEFERLGREAGAELRTAPPADGPRVVQRTATRRRTARTAAAIGGTAVLILVALVAVDRSRNPDDRERTVATTPSVTTAPAIAGAWREIAADPRSPVVAASSVWTGREAIIFGFADAEGQEPTAVAYDVGLDRWRKVADPPAELPIEDLVGPGRTPRWTGSKVLAATSDGSVFAYDPVDDTWSERAAADGAMDAPAERLIAVSPRGVLAHSSEGWWWYDDETDRWASLDGPALGAADRLLAALDDDEMLLSQIDGSTITSSVFDIESRTWEGGPSVQGPEVVREGLGVQCDAANGLLVCTAEGYNSMEGVVIDPLAGVVGTFSLGEHSSSLHIEGTPWYAHADKILLPRAEPAWEDLPPRAGGIGFGSAVWTGSELVFFGGTTVAGGDPAGTVAAYTPRQTPGR